MSLLDDYLRAREKYLETKLDLQDALVMMIRNKDGGDPDMIRDILVWNGEVRVLVSDFEHKNTRQLIFTIAEIEDALRANGPIVVSRFEFEAPKTLQ